MVKRNKGCAQYCSAPLELLQSCSSIHDVLLAKGATAATIKKFLNLGFDPSQTRALDVRVGSIATGSAEITCPLMSVLHPIPTVNSWLWDLSRRANKRHMQRSKKL